MTIATLTPWANGVGALVAVPPAGKMLSGWVGDEQPPCDWENWINKTTIDKINEMIPRVNVAVIDIVNGGSYFPIGFIKWDFSGFGGSNTDFVIQGDSFNPAFGVFSSSPLASVYFSNAVGQALRVIGDTTGLTPSKSPFRVSPLKAIPTTMEGGDLCIVNGSLVYYDKTSGKSRMARSVGLSVENLYLSISDMSTNETAGVRDWNFSASGIPVNIVSKNARPCYAACFPLIGRIPYYNIYLSEIRVQLSPGANRGVGNRMSVFLMDAISGAVLSGIAYDNGSSGTQYVNPTVGTNLDFNTQSPVIVVTAGTTNGIDTILNIRLTLNGLAN